MSRMHRTTRHSRRTGLTLVEVMVALVLVAVGLLGIAGTSALLFRAAVAQRAERHATRQAALRLAWLASLGCAAARDGSADEAATGLHESWHVAMSTAGVAEVEHHASWPTFGATRSATVRSAFLC